MRILVAEPLAAEGLDDLFIVNTVAGADKLRVIAALARLSSTPIKQRWDDEVTVAVLPEAVEGGGVQFLELESIFYCS